MPSPFPGMDPYLEEPGLWPDVHHGLISQIQAELHRRVRPKYHVRVEQRIYVSDENDPGREVIIPVVWPILLTQRLPILSIPLRCEDEDVPLDLQEVLNTAYDRAAYDLAIDYRLAPVPPLTEAQQRWAHNLLQSHGLLE